MKKATKMKSKSKKPKTKQQQPTGVNALIGTKVILATSSRPWSVVYGTLEETYTLGDDVYYVLKDARMLAYWDASSKTLLGIASNGISSSGRVSDAASKVRVRNVELIIGDLSQKAITSIEAAPWG